MYKQFSMILVTVVVAFAFLMILIFGTGSQARNEISTESINAIVSTEINQNFDYLSRKNENVTYVDVENFEKGLVSEINKLNGVVVSDKKPEIRVEYAMKEDRDQTSSNKTINLYDVKAVSVTVTLYSGEEFTASYEFDVNK